MRWETGRTWEQFVSVSLAGTDPGSLSHWSLLHHLKTMPVSQFTSSSLFFPSKSREDKSEPLQRAWNVDVLNEKSPSRLLSCPSLLTSSGSIAHPCVLAHPRALLPHSPRRTWEKRCWSSCTNSYGEGTRRWSPEMLLGPCAQDGVCFHAVRVYSPLWPTLNNTQFSSIGADIFILCVI